MKFTLSDLKPLALLIMVIIADQYTKFLIMENFRLYEGTPVISGFFNLVYVTNTGAAFGFLAGDAVAWRQVFFVCVASMVLVGLLLSYDYFKRQGRLFPYAIALIAGGAVGNLIDRLRFGSVVDFLDFYVRKYHWPAFNLADSAICIGVAFFILGSVSAEMKEKEKQSLGGGYGC